MPARPEERVEVRRQPLVRDEVAERPRLRVGVLEHPAQAAALILFVVALANLIYGSYFGGGPPLIVMSIMGFGMSFILWRMKPKG